MDLPRHRTEPPLSRAGLVLGLYGAMALSAVLFSAGRGDVDLYRIDGTSTTRMLLLSPVLGAAIGLAVVFLSRLCVKHFTWGRALHRSFADILGPLSNREILVLALASSIGEELLFRGAVQPWLGLWVQAIIFAALHVGPGVRFLPWTLSAFVLGLLFGRVFEFTGDLGAPIVAHFTINYLNLRYIARVKLPDEEDDADPVDTAAAAPDLPSADSDS